MEFESARIGGQKFGSGIAVVVFISGARDARGCMGMIVSCMAYGGVDVWVLHWFIDHGLGHRRDMGGMFA